MRVPTMNWWQVWRRYRWAALIWLLPALWLGVVGATQAQTPAPAPLAETIELTPGERAFVQRHPVVRVANDHTYAPFDFFEHGQPQGYSIELIRLLLHKLGLRPEFVDGSDWNAALGQLRAGQIDVVTSVQYTDSDAQYLLFSAPYLRAREVILTRSDNRSIRSALDLRGRVVAMPHSYDYLNVLREHGIKFTHLPVANMAEAVEAVALGRADATLEAEMVLQHIITQRGYTDLQMVYRLFGDRYGNFYTGHFGVRKDLPQLQVMLNKALAALTPQERTALYLKWFGHSLGVRQASVDSRLTMAEQTFVRQRAGVSVCLPENRPPYIWRVDATKNAPGRVALQGLLWDYLELLGSRVGLSFEPHLVSSVAAARQALRAGRCEVAVLAPGTFTELSWHWTEHFLNLPYVLATSSSELFVEDMRDVAQRRFALGDNEALWNDLRLFYPGIQLQSVPRAVDGVAAVHSGQVFAYIDTPVAVAFALQQDALADVKVVGKTPFALSLAFAMPEHASPLLHGVLQKAVDSLSDADRQTLMSRWLSLRSEEGIDYSRAWMVGGMALLALALTLWWNRTLHQARQRAQQAVDELRQMQLELQETNRQLEQMATTDRLTGVYNRMRLEQLLEHGLEAAAHGTGFAVVMLDVDHFKQVNDTWGHLVGDAVLVGIGTLLQTGVRATDAAGRWGGEEFLLVCRDTDLAGAMHLADTLRQRLREHDWSAVPQHITASFGVAAYRSGDTVETLVGRADAALYRAKHLGRDRVEAEAS